MYSEESNYYRKVQTYYNEDSVNFKGRGESNPLLKRIRESFREECRDISFRHALEIGYGPGFDLIYFASNHPNSLVYGMDISDGMQQVAQSSIEEAGLKNCQALVGSVEDISERIPDVQFDFIYVFFGGLNTVENLNKAAEELNRHLVPGGSMVLTFVNKWYMLGILKPLFKLRFSTAFKRLKKTWGGYSTSRFLPSKCYSPSQIRRAFHGLNEVRHRGYSILFPAWYESPKQISASYKSRSWKMDKWLSQTFFWRFGEYTLFHFKKGR